MFDELHDFCLRPSLYSRATSTELWTRPALAGNMLKYHLDPHTRLSSRPEAQIDLIVRCLDRRLALEGKHLCDLGCGPGLYSSRFASLGATVSGVDVSGTSIAYARRLAEESGHDIRYILADYCRDELPPGFDVVTLIYYDYAALTSEQRSRLLGRVHAMLKPGGHLVLDVPALSAFSTIVESTAMEPQLMNGFWSDEDYVGLERVWRYEDQQVSLNRYLIVEQSGMFEIFNWMQYYSADSVTAELASGCFEVLEIQASLAGSALPGDPETLGVIARRAD